MAALVKSIGIETALSGSFVVSNSVLGGVIPILTRCSFMSMRNARRMSPSRRVIDMLREWKIQPEEILGQGSVVSVMGIHHLAQAIPLAREAVEKSGRLKQQ